MLISFFLLFFLVHSNAVLSNKHRCYHDSSILLRHFSASQTLSLSYIHTQTLIHSLGTWQIAWLFIPFSRCSMHCFYDTVLFFLDILYVFCMYTYYTLFKCFIWPTLFCGRIKFKEEKLIIWTYLWISEFTGGVWGQRRQEWEKKRERISIIKA